MKPTLIADHVSKLYHLGARQRADRTLREAIMNVAAGPWRRLQRLSQWRTIKPETVAGSPLEETLWALRDISFEVQPGVVVGIIGRNGSGKSTLLKIFSQIVQLTAGRIEVRGRLSSLLEVGTGFHGELTGRENIFLNGAILGMSRHEIKRKFDAIVDFAEIGKFLDTPVKRYSSGMYVRLAFAVAAHLEPEILLLDEVLAVGDAAFQKKCLEKMASVAKAGLTVLFVSHNLSAISALCQRVIVLENGGMLFDGPTRAGIERYMSSTSRTTEQSFDHLTHWGPRRYARITSFTLSNEAGQPGDTFLMGDTLVVELDIVCTQRVNEPEIGFALQNRMGMNVELFISTWEGWHGPLEPGTHRFRVRIPKIHVYPGTYSLTPWVLRLGERLDHQVDHAAVFKVLEADLTGHRPYFESYTQTNCEVYSPSTWSHTALPAAGAANGPTDRLA
jgi:lipopolysaccharide transport system ATP-binding protein